MQQYRKEENVKIKMQDFSLQSLIKLNEAKSSPAGATYNEGLRVYSLWENRKLQRSIRQTKTAPS